MKLGDYVGPELVKVGLEDREPKELLSGLVELAARAGRVSDPASVLSLLLERERAHPTALGSGVAVPHALCAELHEALVVVGVAPGGARFGAEDDGPVHLFFLLLSPPGRSTEHIKLLARIARLARDARFRSSLRSSRSPQEVVDAIRAFETHHL
ncbi:MAG: PTS sugar transporter subunit IIA [Candidatus Palauibacterales bacterium]|nr:PTS sugar transporter subunit IIA [Candidatus Palauibacterales bacterium]MDP2530514.1 PTS sugar transporter subunit IIA [Candidatus Palauibacterales bacterium]MDP2582927.1 PTS sugar transporter subunit IIA [Candidatus Palauibacterales bacterium]